MAAATAKPKSLLPTRRRRDVRVLVTLGKWRQGLEDYWPVDHVLRCQCASFGDLMHGAPAPGESTSAAVQGFYTSNPTMIAGAFDVAHTQSEVSIDTTPAIEIAFYYLLL